MNCTGSLWVNADVVRNILHGGSELLYELSWFLSTLSKWRETLCWLSECNSYTSSKVVQCNSSLKTVPKGPQVMFQEKVRKFSKEVAITTTHQLLL